MLRPDAVKWLDAQTPTVRAYIIQVIRDKAARPTDQMVVLNMTCQLPDHCYRAMKNYRWSPGMRIIFYCTSNPTGIVITRIRWRDCDPYAV